MEGSRTGFIDRIADLVNRIECRPARTGVEIETFLRLRYEAYAKEGAVPDTSSRKLEDRFDVTGNVRNFGFYLDGRLASAIRVHVLSRPEDVSPALETFPDVLGPHLAAGKIIVDPNRFVVDYTIARRYPELPYVTVRAAYLGGVHFDADVMTASVRAEHQAFYRRYLSFRVACPPRPYPTLTKPISLMLLDFKKDASTIANRLPPFRSLPSERVALYGTAVSLPEKASLERANDWQLRPEKVRRSA